MWKPVTLMPIEPRTGDLKPIEPLFNTYALGWDVRDYRGTKPRLARRRRAWFPLRAWC